MCFQITCAVVLPKAERQCRLLKLPRLQPSSVFWSFNESFLCFAWNLVQKDKSCPGLGWAGGGGTNTGELRLQVRAEFSRWRRLLGTTCSKTEQI